jgi:[FeFe] hydrogenase H-cluster maturation GTPase HydF
VAEPDKWTGFEEMLADTFAQRKTPCMVVFSKADVSAPDAKILEELKRRKLPHASVSSKTGDGVEDLKRSIASLAPEAVFNQSLLAGVLGPGKMAVLVVPIDLEAPKGRLILPQVQTIREILDGDAYCMVVKERELKHALQALRTPPALVITDSQAFLKVSADVPELVPLTSFSILMARQKGDLEMFAEGALAVSSLKSGDKVLIAEACSHHPVGEDIGRVKIPRWLSQFTGKKLEFKHVQGHDFPDDLSGYGLVIHCGACTFNRKNMQSRLESAGRKSVPITNYGVLIAHLMGILKRSLCPFPEMSDFLSKSGL